MKIVHITEPYIVINDEIVHTDSRMYRSLNDFQIEIDRKERKGATICYFHSLWTQHEKGYDLGEIKENGVPEFIHNDKDIIIYWVRCKFIKE